MDDNRELRLRRAIITALKANAAITAIVGARVYDEVVPKPTWPFIRYGFPIMGQWLADGWEGETVALTIHAFAKGPGTDRITALKTAIRNVLDEAELTLTGDGGVLLLQFSGSQVLRDTEESSAYHAVVEFEAATALISGTETPVVVSGLGPHPMMGWI